MNHPAPTALPPLHLLCLPGPASGHQLLPQAVLPTLHLIPHHQLNIKGCQAYLQTATRLSFYLNNLSNLYLYLSHQRLTGLISQDSCSQAPSLSPLQEEVCCLLAPGVGQGLHTCQGSSVLYCQPRAPQSTPARQLSTACWGKVLKEGSSFLELSSLFTQQNCVTVT